MTETRPPNSLIVKRSARIRISWRTLHDHDGAEPRRGLGGGRNLCVVDNEAAFRGRIHGSSSRTVRTGGDAAKKVRVRTSTKIKAGSPRTRRPARAGSGRADLRPWTAGAQGADHRGNPASEAHPGGTTRRPVPVQQADSSSSTAGTPGEPPGRRGPLLLVGRAGGVRPATQRGQPRGLPAYPVPLGQLLLQGSPTSGRPTGLLAPD